MPRRELTDDERDAHGEFQAGDGAGPGPAMADAKRGTCEMSGYRTEVIDVGLTSQALQWKVLDADGACWGYKNSEAEAQQLIRELEAGDLRRQRKAQAERVPLRRLPGGGWGYEVPGLEDTYERVSDEDEPPAGWELVR